MKKKVLVLNSYYYPDIIGGAEISVKLLVEDLLAAGFEVVVITTSTIDCEDFINGAKIIRINHRNLYWLKDSENKPKWKKVVWHLNAMLGWNTKKKLKEIIIQEKPIAVLSQNLLGIGTSHWKITNKLKIPSLLTVRDYALIKPTPINWINSIAKLIVNQRIKDIDVVVGVSEYILKDLVRGIKSLREVDLEVIYNKVNKSILKEKNLSNQKLYSYSDMGKKINLGFVGQINMNKGLEELLKAVMDDNGEIESIIDRVRVVGDGLEKKSLEYQYKNISGIEFLGKLSYEETIKVIDSLDILIVPSKWDEPFGRVVVEGYARGKIVLASNKGGIPEIIIDPNHLFEPTYKDIKKKIKSLYYNKIMYSEAELVDYASKFKENVGLYKELIERVIK